MKKSTRLILSAASSLFLLGATGFIWYQSVVPSSAYANLGDCNNNPDYKGCYSEVWTASKVLGDVKGFDVGGLLSAAVTTPTTLYWTGDGYTNQAFAGYGIPSIPAHDDDGQLLATSPTTVVQWTVSGYINE